MTETRKCRVLVILDGSHVAHLVRAEGPWLAVCGRELHSGMTHHECWREKHPPLCRGCRKGEALALCCVNNRTPT